ncbi:ABC transporter permease [Streptococcus pyogenes]|uniref:ABC transporter permease n=1 Tax=Streptococcus pyogenes TaxID=1314 RepID=UPI00044F1C0D|nr:ABC transporter permease [Streptococcus pyogenes]HER4518713.1 ABC transporter permease [Streptococcus pyogenes NGAS755]HER4577376.1 ABC transporter permease [Streptococcus pyogenes NGAS638]AKZ52547.1 ABC transporter permease [Streptococcus pyogenes]EZL51974.1 ABC transporter permease [Streptococcus pyogenes ABC020030925]OAC69120.1 ABC transporter permease [Streptococcus pyogenes]
MNWSTIWELIKINILYSNPQSLANLKKRQEKHPKENFKAYKSMMRQQALMIAMFLVIYLFMFIGVDFSHYPGLFSFDVAMFFIMSTLTAFSSLYTIFYESNDLKLYIHLPVTSEELYIAKIVSSLGMGTVFLMPLISLLLIVCWQLLGNPLSILVAIVLFLVLLVSSMVLAIYINAWVGKIIVRSRKRKLISTIMMFVSTFGAFVLIFAINISNNKRTMMDGVFTDYPTIPYFKGFYDVVQAPFATVALLNFWLPLLLILAMVYGIVTKVMPTYYREAFYISNENKVKQTKKPVNRPHQNQSLAQLLRKHHLLTLQNATLLTQTYLMPLMYVMLFIGPSLSRGTGFFKHISPDYFGVALLFGVSLGVMCATPTSFIGVGISLEKDNFTFIKSLPITLKKFLMDKFCLLVGLQLIVPMVIYLVFGLFVLHLHPLLTIAFCLGYALSLIVQGELMYRRDYRLLDLKWQDMTQLFTRGNGQWLTMGLIFGNLIVTGVVGFGAVIIANIIQQPLLISILLSCLTLMVLGIAHLWIQKTFWKSLEKL